MCACPAFAAGLIGETASGNYYYPTTTTVYDQAMTVPETFVIGPGIDTTADVEGVTSISFDFAASSLDIVINTVLRNPTWSDSVFNGMIFTSPAFASISGIGVDPSSTFAGFDASRATIVGNDLRLNWGGLSYVDGTTLHLTFAGLGGGGAVPEPEAWALMIAGAAIVGAAARRRPATIATV